MNKSADIEFNGQKEENIIKSIVLPETQVGNVQCRDRLNSDNI